MSNLRVNSKCIMCGACLGLGYDFLIENSDGSISVIENTFLSKDSVELKKLNETCPVHALEFDNSVKVISKQEQLEKIKEQLRNWPGLSCPTENDLKFDGKKYSMSMPVIGGSRYTYSSERAALDAAESEFDNKAYSKIDIFILQVISQYRADKLSPYYTYGPDTNSVYYKENQKIISLLKQAEKLSDRDLGSNFAEFDVSPSNDSCYKWLRKGELVGDNLIEEVRTKFKSGNYSSLSSYRMYFDTDDMEMYAPSGLFGKEKLVDRYCYKSLTEAIRELESDLYDALWYVDDEIIDHAKGVVDGLVYVYNDEAKKEIERKLIKL